MSQERNKIPIRIDKAIKDGNIDDLKNIINQIKKEETNLKKNTETSGFEIPNLVILACRYNTVDILRYLLANDAEVLCQINGTNTPLPEDVDEFQHNAFYYAIRSCNTELFITLITDWPAASLSYNNFDIMDDTLSKAYEEMNVKNIRLSSSMIFIVESCLIKIRFFSDKTQPQASNKKATQRPLDNIKKRITFLNELIALLGQECVANGNKIDDRFLFLSKCIAQNVFVLKCQLKSTYTILPWEEIEFCLICFILSHKTQQEMNIFYHSTLRTEKLLKYLNLFAEKLREVETTHLQNVEIQKIAKPTNLSRDEVVSNIILVCPQFEELYNDHQQIRDIYSLIVMAQYIDVSMNVDPKLKDGQLVITRTLLKIGEHFKNTLDSPKLSQTTSDRLLFSLSSDTKKIITDVRNSLAHASALSQRIQIEKDANFFIGVQQDCKKLGVLIADIIYKNKCKHVIQLFEEIVNSKCSERMREICNTLMHCFYDEDFNGDNFRNEDHKVVKGLFDKLRIGITMPTNYETEMIQKVDGLLESEKEAYAQIQKLYAACFEICNELRCYFDDEYDNVKLKKLINFNIHTLINREKTLKEATYTKFEGIRYYSAQILTSFLSRTQNDDKRRLEIHAIVNHIIFISSSGTCDVKYIKELGQRIKQASKHKDQKTDFTSINVKSTYELGQTLKEFVHKLKNSLDITHSQSMCIANLQASFEQQLLDKVKNKFDETEQSGVVSISPSCKENLNESIEKHLRFYFTTIEPSFQHNKKLQAIVELHVLDILNILGESKICVLENNFLSLSENSPLIIGKSLRNHLAHDNIIIDLLVRIPPVSILFNALQLIQECIISDKKRIGKVLPENLARVRENFNWGLEISQNQKIMFTAMQSGNFDDFMCCLQKGADIYARCCRMRTTLHYASIGGSLEIVEYLHNRNVPADARDIYSKSALHFAAEYGRTNVVEFFLSKQLNSVDQQTGLYETALHLAAGKGHKDTVECLLKYNASTSKENCIYRVPLQKAVLQRHMDVIEVLLEKEGDAEVINELNLLHLASESGSPDLVRYLLERGANVNESIIMTAHTPLHVATKCSHLAIVSILIENKANVNSTDMNGYAAIHFAAINGHDNIFNVLLKHGANINAVCSENLTPLHFAIQNKNEQIVEICLKNGADADFNISIGAPLNLATASGNLYIVNALLRHGVKTNCKDKEGRTLLHDLVFCQISWAKEIVELLLKSGADIDARDNYKWTPLHIASSCGNIDIVEYLLTNGADVSALGDQNRTPLHCAAMEDKIDVVTTLIKNKASVNALDANGITPFWYAACNNYSRIVKYILENNYEGRLVGDPELMVNRIVSCGHVDIVKVLLQHKSKMNDGLMEGFLKNAVTYGNIETVKICIENGANVNPQVEENASLLSCATLLNRKDIVKLLVSNGANIDFFHCQVAVQHGHIAIVEFLLSKKPIVNKIIGGYSLLSKAIANGDKEMVSALIRHGADVNSADKNNSGICKDISPFHAAVFKGNNEIIKIMLQNGADINLNSFVGTPLHGVVVQNNLECLKLMVESGKAKMNKISNYNGYTILHHAAENDNLEMVEYIIANGSDIDAKTLNLGMKAIHIAAANGFKNIVEFLHTTGSNVDEKALLNKTPLHFASERGHLEVVKYLVANNASINHKDLGGFTPLHYAIENRCKNIEKNNLTKILLENGADINLSCTNGVTPLHLAVYGNMLESVKLMVESGKAKMNIKSSQNDYTILHLAADKGNLEMVEYLIDNGSDIDAKTLDFGMKAIHFAAEEGHTHIVEFLHKTGLDLDEKTLQNKTPLHYATKNGHMQVVQYLIANNACINNQDLEGYTPLHNAAALGRINIVEMLLHNGAMYDTMNIKNETALDVAISSEISNLLISTANLFEAVKENNCSKVENSLKKGALINSTNNEGLTPLDYATGNGFDDIVQILLNNKANPNAFDSNEDCQLRLIKYNLSLQQENVLTAATNGNIQTLKDLIAKGSSVNEAASDGMTPLHYAVHSEHTDIVKILLENGANVTQVTKNKGNTPLHIAVSKKNMKIIDLLLQYTKSCKPEDFINAKTTKTGSTALHVAVANTGSFDIVKLLLKYGAAYDSINQKGELPYQLSNDQRVKSLLKLIGDLFDLIHCGNSEAINLLKTLNAEEFLIATNAKNRQGQRLVQTWIPVENKTLQLELIKTHVIKTLLFTGKIKL